MLLIIRIIIPCFQHTTATGIFGISGRECLVHHLYGDLLGVMQAMFTSMSWSCAIGLRYDDTTKVILFSSLLLLPLG